MIAKAPDATAFLSASAVIIGIFLTVVTAALVSSLPDRLEDLIRPTNRDDPSEWYTRAIRSTLFILIITNTLGTLFPFTLLVVDTMMSIPSAWVWVAFSYSIYAVIINLGAVSAIFIGPMSVRRRLIRDKFNAGGKRKAVMPNPAVPVAAQKAVRDSSTQPTRWHGPIRIGLGIMIGVTVAILVKRRRPGRR
jgi:hypothetical protein